jgi:uncharacterized protein YggE
MNTKLLKPLSWYGPVLLAGALYLAGSLAPDFINSKKKHDVQISAQGKANLRVHPDTAKFNVSLIVKLAKSPGEATKMIGNKIDKFSEAIENFKGVTYSLQTMKMGQEILGVNKKYARTYHASQSVEFKISDFSQIQPVIDAAIKNGLNEIGTVHYSLESKKKFRNQARKIAIKAARENGASIAKSLGMKTGEMRNYNETISNYQYDEQDDFAVLDQPLGTASKSGSQMPDPISVHHSVTMDFELK